MIRSSNAAEAVAATRFPVGGEARTACCGPRFSGARLSWGSLRVSCVVKPWPGMCVGLLALFTRSRAWYLDVEPGAR